MGTYKTDQSGSKKRKPLKKDTVKKKEQNRTTVNKKAMLKALEQTLGVVTTACKKVGIINNTHYAWMASDEQYKKDVTGIADIALDFVESQLFGQIKSGNTTASIFYLKTKGKKRGFVERTEHVHKEQDHFDAMDAMTDEQIRQEIERLRAKNDD